MRGRAHVALLALGAVSLLLSNNPMEDNYELSLRVQGFTEALVRRDARAAYRFFNSTFRDEIPFVRFDSAFRNWYGTGRVVKAQHKVVDVQGSSGSVSTWVVFEGERDARYLFQSWLLSKNTWELVWVSRIIDESFQYGRSDTAELRRVAQTALRHALTAPILARLSGRPRRPDTVVLVRLGQPEEAEVTVEGAKTVWLSPAQVGDLAILPRVPFYVGFGIVRVLGEIAEVAVDFYPTPYGRLPRRQSVKVLLRRATDGWRFSSATRVW
jgi:hypothetical protein